MAFKNEDRVTLDHRFNLSGPRIRSIDLAGAAVMVTALLTVSVQAVKAAQANPVKSLSKG